MDLAKTKKSAVLPYLVVAFLFVVACVLQQVDDLFQKPSVSLFLSLVAQCIYFGILSYWTISLINRVSNKRTRVGMSTTIVLMSSLLFLKLVKYNVVFDETAGRYFWYSYYIPQCLSPVVLFLTVLGMGEEKDRSISKWWYSLFFPALALILLVFTNDLHEQVFSFAEGLENANSVYKWEWGYYLILFWIAGLYFVCGILLFLKCQVSHCRRKAWIPLFLFLACVTLCLLREVFNPSFIKMPEMVVFSLVVVCESLICIGFVPSNQDHEAFFDASETSSIIVDNDFHIKMKSRNAPSVKREWLISALQNGEFPLSKDLTLKGKTIRGGKVFWVEDSSLIHKINRELEATNLALSEEADLVAAENRLKEQQSAIEEQNILYERIFSVLRLRLSKIKRLFAKAKSNEEIDLALRLSLVYGTYLKRRSNLTLLESNSLIPFQELLLALKESLGTLTFLNVTNSLKVEGKGQIEVEKVEFIYDFYEECIERSLPALSSCLVNIKRDEGSLICRLMMESEKFIAPSKWRVEELQRLNGSISFKREEGTIFAVLTFIEKGELK